MVITAKRIKKLRPRRILPTAMEAGKLHRNIGESMGGTDGEVGEAMTNAQMLIDGMQSLMIIALVIMQMRADRR